jgi:hypothetical protein
MKVWIERLDELWRLAFFLAVLGGIVYAGYLGVEALGEALGVNAWMRAWSSDTRTGGWVALVIVLVILPLAQSLDQVEKRVNRLSEQVYELRSRVDRY